jgi:nitroimidazol reductase NimA-like FMN-containing flavoprotein (pyridoxamine 5'-phosphate oxidase superfamily)
VPLTPEELDAFLAEPRLCHFATVDSSGRPRVRPLWYLWRDGSFWFTTRLEARHTGRDVVAGSQVTISIATEERPYRAVVARGRPEVVGKDRDLLLAISTRYGEAAGRRWTAGAMKEHDRTVLRMTPRTMVSWDYGRGDYRRESASPPRR